MYGAGHPQNRKLGTGREASVHCSYNENLRLYGIVTGYGVRSTVWKPHSPRSINTENSLLGTLYRHLYPDRPASKLLLHVGKGNGYTVPYLHIGSYTELCCNYRAHSISIPFVPERVVLPSTTVNPATASSGYSMVYFE